MNPILLIKKIIKKRRLIKKYTIDYEKDIRLCWLMGTDEIGMEFRRHLAHVRACELRFLRRIKKL
jgi:hypothetical protein